MVVCHGSTSERGVSDPEPLSYKIAAQTCSRRSHHAALMWPTIHCSHTFGVSRFALVAVVLLPRKLQLELAHELTPRGSAVAVDVLLSHLCLLSRFACYCRCCSTAVLLHLTRACVISVCFLPLLYGLFCSLEGVRAQQPRRHHSLGRAVVPYVSLLPRRNKGRRVQGSQYRTSRAESEPAQGDRKVCGCVCNRELMYSATQHEVEISIVHSARFVFNKTDMASYPTLLFATYEKHVGFWPHPSSSSERHLARCHPKGTLLHC